MRRTLPLLSTFLVLAVIGCGGGSSGGSSTRTTSVADTTGTSGTLTSTSTTGTTSTGTASTTSTTSTGGTTSTTGGTGTTGIGDGSTTGANGADKYVGTWTGTYATEATGSLDLHGTMTITIRRALPTDLGVTITGTVVDALRGTGTVTGGITDVNPAQGSYLFLVFSGPGGYSFKGAPALATNGHLVGPIGLDVVDSSIPTDLDLSPVTP